MKLVFQLDEVTYVLYNICATIYFNPFNQFANYFTFKLRIFIVGNYKQIYLSKESCYIIFIINLELYMPLVIEIETKKLINQIISLIFAKSSSLVLCFLTM